MSNTNWNNNLWEELDNSKRFTENPINNKVENVTNITSKYVDSTLKIEFSGDEINYIKDMNKILDQMILKKWSMMDTLVLLYEYKEKHKFFKYENDVIWKLIEHNLNNTLKKLRIDMSRINFDMVREYIEKNAKK